MMSNRYQNFKEDKNSIAPNKAYAIMLPVCQKDCDCEWG